MFKGNSTQMLDILKKIVYLW